ncbi:metallophosphoesterase [Streptomyces sp. 900116325]
MSRTSHPGPGRRSLLQAALAVPAVGAAGTVLGTQSARAATGQPSTAGSGTHRFDAESPRFALAVLPDTQYLFDADSADPEPLKETFHYLVAQRQEANIAFMTHLGDVTEHGSEEEIDLAADTFRTIDGKVPYSVLAGNHDINLLRSRGCRHRRHRGGRGHRGTRPVGARQRPAGPTAPRQRLEGPDLVGRPP